MARSYSLDLFRDDGFGNRVLRTLPTSSELAEHYGKNFERVSYQRWGKKIEAYHRAWFVRSLIGKRCEREPALLELGSGNGQFMAAFRKLLPKAKLDAVEFANPALSQVAEMHDVRVFDDLQAVEDGSCLYDAIALWHVIEHMPDPWISITKSLQLLKAGGVLVFATPSMFCPGVKRFPDCWPWNQAPPTHIWHFSPHGIRRRLEDLARNDRIEVFTREARDANFIFDALLRPAIFDKLPLPVGVKLRCLSVARILVAIINEAAVNPFLRRGREYGSEIIAMVCRNP